MEEKKNGMDQGWAPGDDNDTQALENSPERLENLYMQAEALKMVNLKNSMDAGANSGADSEKIAAKSSQLVIKAIELQLRILSERSKQGSGNQLELDVILKAMQSVPHLGPLLHRKAVLDQIKEALDKDELF